MSVNVEKIEKALRIKIRNKSNLIEALTHKSANQKINNEKLEFLGDRVIGLILAKKLIELYPKDDEGIIDKKFAKLVNRKTCAAIAWDIGINEFIIIGNQKKKINKKDEKILSDTCESLIGAVYNDRGYNYVKTFILRLWEREIKKSNLTVLDPKTKLQEYSLKIHKKLPIYQLINTRGPRHKPVFKISVAISKSKQFVGHGNSKQEAEQEAANNLLKSININ